TYTNLPPGSYTFRVRASNKDGVWNEQGAALALRVLPPPWRTWWAYALYALLIVGSIAALVRSRVRALHARQRELEQLVAVRTSELAESERRAMEANQAKSVFLANMSHELRTPLNAVLGFSQLLERSASVRGDDRTSLDIIRRAGEHLLGLINDVLSLSKIEAGRLTLDARPFSLQSMLRGVESMMRARADKAGLALVTRIDGELPEAVTGDEGKLRQVLVNLLGNAVKFTERGTVTLRVAWRDDRARFEVEDTGHGIAASELDSLFEAFVQTETGRKSKEGTGLGLVITREIVRLMDGDIAVRSTPGAGTTFSFDVALPRAAALPQAEEASRVIALAQGEKTRRIVVADDTPENRLLILRLLGSVGLEVLEAANGEEAIRAWENTKPDLILMDLRMPVLDGREATRRIREREAAEGRARTPIVALTASAFEHERDEILQCGADDFLTKPFRESQLFAIVEQQTGVRFVRETNAPAQVQTGMTRESVARLTAEESSKLRDALDSGAVDRAAAVAEKVGERDAALGRDLLAEIRAFRIDRLLDLLEGAEA
ncbi:MAG TPA: ATP-binding protein, partial [Thermoanaerobaculia bacterium]|nr:ATP-binding protein [Thermoanaerobaculia bacterium]